MLSMIVGIVLAVIGAQTPTEISIPPPEQPIPFKHRQHLALGLECQKCHAFPEPGTAATFPPTATCMTCHAQTAVESPAIQQLAASHARGEAIAWRRVYRVPEYVSFSHKPHLTGSGAATCDVCHGEVREMDAMHKVRDTSMPACVECHMARGAPTRCDTCHEPR
jgi:hypothetical protein